MVAVNTVWLVMTLLTLPGNWLMVITTVGVAWWQWDKGMFSPWTLAAIVLLAVIGEVLDVATSALGVRKAGGTKRAGLGGMIGSLVGALVGTFVIPVPVVGTVMGTVGGALLGAFGFERSGGAEVSASLKSGLGAGAGSFVGTLLKLSAGIAIWIVATVAAFWP